jgi:acetyltransferase-like isoleucine patch superfamily enzyme
MRAFKSHGTGEFDRAAFHAIGENVVFERGVLVFHPERISIGDNVYVGHYAILKAYHLNEMIVGDDVWIGQQCFFHSAGGLVIESGVGIGPGVRILTSQHREEGWVKPILDSDLEFAAVRIGAGSDIGAGATILPGVTIGRGVQVGAGAVVVGDLPDFVIAAGVPARVIRERPERMVP